MDKNERNILAKNLVMEYFNIFYSTGKFESLENIFDENLIFEGPFFKFNSSRDYIDSLKSDPPIGHSYKIIEIFQNESSVNVVYEFKKENIKSVMSQLFKFNDSKISKILLIFDTKNFTQPDNQADGKR